MSLKKKMVLFDFDGVIADTFDFCLEISQEFHPQLTAEQYRGHFEGNIHDAIKKKGFKYTSKASKAFYRAYGEKLRRHEAIEAMPKVIERLAANHTLLIVTSTLTKHVDDFLKKNVLLRYFKGILGSDVHTNKTHKIESILEEHLKNARDCVFITDTLGDIVEAGRAGVGSIAVSWGFHSVQTLKRGKPYKIVSRPAELSSSIDAYFQKVN